MATITAALSVSSDITSGLSISKSMTMSKAGATTGLNRTSGLQRVYLTNQNHVDLLRGALAGSTVADMTLGASAKVYIKYIEADTSKYVTMGFGAASTNTTAFANDSNGDFMELGRLYGDEWMIIPWSGTADNGDITVHPSVATAAEPAIIEYIVFFED